MIPREPGPPGVDRVYKLDPEPEYRRLWPFRFLATVIVLLMIIWLVIVVVRATEHTLPGGSAALILGGTILPVGVGITIWGTLGLGRGAESCLVTADGVTLVYRGGRTTTFVWNSPGLRLTVFELVSRNRTKYSIATRRPFLNPIPEELCVMIVSGARSRGLIVTEHTDTLSAGHQLTIRVRPVKESSRP
jgi:hypothetical protein